MASVDEIDLKILDLLDKNSRMTWKEIGEIVHMTGQAVASRISKLEDLNVLEGYCIRLNKNKLGFSITALVTVFMKSSNHGAFHRFIGEQKEIEEAFRISGEGCYSLKVVVTNQKELVEFLDKILVFGNYRVNLSISKIK